MKKKNFFIKYLSNASSLDELLSEKFISTSATKSDLAKAKKQINEWCKVATNSDTKKFQKMFKLNNLTFNFTEKRLAKNIYNRKFDEPEWFKDSIWIFDALKDPVYSSRKVKCPFYDLFSSLIPAIKNKFLSQISEKNKKNISKLAIDLLIEQLIKNLSDDFSILLFKEFELFKKENKKNTKGSDIYYAFISNLKNKNLEKIFTNKPIMLRLISEKTRQWIESSVELIDRFSNDQSDISKIFMLSQENLRIVNVTGEIGDSHNYGRSVKTIKLSCGLKIMYKPKNLSLDYKISLLIDKLNLDAPVKVKSLTILNKGEYGWTNFINYKGCSSRKELEAFFVRTGAWLSIFHFFVATDMHEENIIAAGDYPIPIDFEMLFQPSDPENESKSPEFSSIIKARRKIIDSVLMTGLLPVEFSGDKNLIYQMGGLNNEGFITKIDWKELNTDGMFFTFKRVKKTQHNLPFFNKKIVNPREFVSEIIEGFKSYSNYLTFKLKDNKELIGFKSLPVRKILRPTRFYYMLLKRLKDYRYMENGVIWSMQADFIYRFINTEESSSPFFSLYKLEKKALIEFNIPHFTLCANSLVIKNSTSCLKLNGETGYNRSVKRLNNANIKEMEWQIKLVNLSLKSNNPSKVLTYAPPIFEAFKDNRIEYNKILKDIFYKIDHLAIKDKKSCTWIGLDWINGSNTNQLVPLGFSLYNGSLGIALFLSAYYKTFNSIKAKKLANLALHPLFHLLEGPKKYFFINSMGLGAGTGLGSVIYGLSVIYELQEDPNLLKNLLNLSKLITKDLINKSDDYDLLQGLAGLILGLLKLYALKKDKSILNKATICGDRLVIKISAALESDDKFWIGTGMSHGASGYALSLFYLYNATLNPIFLTISKKLLEYENKSFNKKQYNWQHSSEDDKKSKIWLNQWCHGAAGIGLARIGIYKNSTIKDESLLKDIKYAYSCEMKNSNNTLCCGKLGQIEFFNASKSFLDESILKNTSQMLLSQILIDYKDKINTDSDDLNLSLFRGISGIGYTILRQLNSNLPNVLIWE